jgi:hypothetical protein
MSSSYQPEDGAAMGEKYCVGIEFRIQDSEYRPVAAQHAAQAEITDHGST